MSSLDLDQVAQDWIKHSSISNPKRSPFVSAWETFNALVRDDPEIAWLLIEKVHELDQSDITLANLAAGPLEDLLVLHGENFIVRVETTARQDPAFRKLLGAVWRNDIPEEIWRRVESAAGPTF